MPLTILADDLTGACDTGALFAGRGPVVVAVAPANPAGAREVLVLDTESRSLPPPLAARRVEESLAALLPARRAGRIFKKIDSTLRGRVGAEVEALCEATGTPGALVCPAFPAEGRTVVDRILRAHGHPVHQTAVGRDPDFPAATSDVVEILSAQVRRPVRWLSLAQVRERPDELARAVGRTSRALVVADAETDEDLQALADAALAASRPMLLAGSAGLARAAAARLGYAGDPIPLPTAPAWLIVAGSLHPATRAQMTALDEGGISGVRLAPDGSAPEDRMVSIRDTLRSGRPAFVTVTSPPGPPASIDRRRAAAALAHVVARVLEEVTPALLVVVGGETAIAVYQALKAELIEVLGAPLPGLALGRLSGGGAGGCLLLTKAGGFGAPDLFLTLGHHRP